MAVSLLPLLILLFNAGTVLSIPVDIPFQCHKHAIVSTYQVWPTPLHFVRFHEDLPDAIIKSVHQLEKETRQVYFHMDEMHLATQKMATLELPASPILQGQREDLIDAIQSVIEIFQKIIVPIVMNTFEKLHIISEIGILAAPLFSKDTSILFHDRVQALMQLIPMLNDRIKELQMEGSDGLQLFESKMNVVRDKLKEWEEWLEREIELGNHVAYLKEDFKYSSNLNDALNTVAHLEGGLNSLQQLYQYHSDALKDVQICTRAINMDLSIMAMCKKGSLVEMYFEKEKGMIFIQYLKRLAMLTRMGSNAVSALVQKF